jgi:hypothetical protein
MLTADQIRDLLRCLPDAQALAILSLMAGEGSDRSMVYEAERIAAAALGAERGNELIASMVKGTVTA